MEHLTFEMSRTDFPGIKYYIVIIHYALKKSKIKCGKYFFKKQIQFYMHVILNVKLYQQLY